MDGTFTDSYVGRVIASLRTINEEQIEAFVDLLVAARERDSRVFIIGNGGSATTASHMATDLGVGAQRVGAGIRICSLADNAGVITATGNDLSFGDIYSAQVRLLGLEGDILVVISASGNSPNLIEASEVAKRMGMKLVGVTGFSGGRIKEIADVSIHVHTNTGDYGPAEDAHLVVNHMVTELLRRRLGKSSDTKGDHA